MRAVTFSVSGPARDVLHVVDRPVPEPGPGEVRVKYRVHADKVVMQSED